MFNLFNIKRLLILGLVPIIFLVIVIILILGKNNNSSKTIPNQQSAGKASSSINDINRDQKEQLNQQALVSALIIKTPYKGKNFTLDFNYSTGSFLLILNKNNLDRGNSEFDLFLKQNGVLSRSWFTNLQTYSQAFTPAP